MCWDISACPCSIVDSETDEGESGMVVATEDRRGRRLLSESRWAWCACGGRDDEPVADWRLKCAL